MKRYAFNINEITKERPNVEESKHKLANYLLKSELGLMEPYDENNNIPEKNIQLIGFKDYAEYEMTKFKVIEMIDNNVPVPYRIKEQLKQA